MTIHALPGTGADQRMYPPAWNELEGFVAHDWTAVRHCRTLPEVAAALVERIGIRDGDGLIGSSLGGMVACEITKLCQVSHLFLVGSARRKEEVSPWLAAVHPLAKVAPLTWLQFSAGKLPGEMADMFAHSAPEFVRSMCLAIFEWEGLDDTATRVFRLHGRFDFVIPPPPNADLLLNAGHMIAMSHPRECVDFIREQLS